MDFLGGMLASALIIVWFAPGLAGKWAAEIVDAYRRRLIELRNMRSEGK